MHNSNPKNRLNKNKNGKAYGLFDKQVNIKDVCHDLFVAVAIFADGLKTAQHA